jgi:hypothetical protein
MSTVCSALFHKTGYLRIRQAHTYQCYWSSPKPITTELVDRCCIVSLLSAAFCNQLKQKKLGNAVFQHFLQSHCTRHRHRGTVSTANVRWNIPYFSGYSVHTQQLLKFPMFECKNLFWLNIAGKDFMIKRGKYISCSENKISVAPDHWIMLLTKSSDF